MIIARRPTAANPVAKSVRDFAVCSVRLETRPAAAPSAAAELDLVRLYPSIFGDARQASPAARYLRVAPAALSVTALAVAAMGAFFHH